MCEVSKAAARTIWMNIDGLVLQHKVVDHVSELGRKAKERKYRLSPVPIVQVSIMEQEKARSSYFRVRVIIAVGVDSPGLIVLVLVLNDSAYFGPNLLRVNEEARWRSKVRDRFQAAYALPLPPSLWQTRALTAKNDLTFLTIAPFRSTPFSNPFLVESILNNQHESISSSVTSIQEQQNATRNLQTPLSTRMHPVHDPRTQLPASVQVRLLRSQ